MGEKERGEKRKVEKEWAQIRYKESQLEKQSLCSKNLAFRPEDLLLPGKTFKSEADASPVRSTPNSIKSTKSHCFDEEENSKKM